MEMVSDWYGKYKLLDTASEAGWTKRRLILASMVNIGLLVQRMRTLKEYTQKTFDPTPAIAYRAILGVGAIQNPKPMMGA